VCRVAAPSTPQHRAARGGNRTNEAAEEDIGCLPLAVGRSLGEDGGGGAKVRGDGSCLPAAWQRRSRSRVRLVLHPPTGNPGALTAGRGGGAARSVVDAGLWKFPLEAARIYSPRR
jgi:hypothetical protein